MADWVAIDEYLFHAINSGLAHPLLDAVMPLFRDKYFWMPFYMFLLSWLVLNNPTSKVAAFIVVTVMCVILCDQISSSFFKPLVGRLRPCHDPDLKDHIRILINCGGYFSFVSSHATNHFGLAALWGLSFFRKGWWVLLLLMLWAGIISIAQVYVGVHFPLDIFAGGFIGLSIGTLLFTAFKKRLLI